MKAKPGRIKSLSQNFSALLEQEQRACHELITSLEESFRLLQSDTGDTRFQRLASQLKSLEERFDLLAEMGRGDFLAKINRETDELMECSSGDRATRLITSLIRNDETSLNSFCERLLDQTIEAIKAERGFMLFYIPESTEADLVAARNYQSNNLSLGEYSYSRSLLGEVLRRGTPLLVEDASEDPNFSNEASVIKYDLKSVLSVPLKQNGRTIGALYFENNSRPCAFDEEDLRLIECAAQLAVFYLRHSRLLPTIFESENRIFFDPGKAPRDIVGNDPKIVSLFGIVSRVADSPATVLIEGESGTGKELVARALHYESSRRDSPFVAINCAAIPDNLLESELFGYERGAFTGATERYTGRIEQGDGGTVFLDEISELAYGLQAKLLRFLQSNEFTRLGGKQTIKVDVRIVAATSKDLRAMMEAGKFQEALFYRLNVIPVRLPSLRERPSDIPLLIGHFLEKFSGIYGRTTSMDRETVEALQRYGFPGNVRELENILHRLVALTSDDLIRIGDLPEEVLRMHSQRVSLRKNSLEAALETPPADLEELRQRKQQIRRALAEQERSLIERAVEEADGNLTLAASRLGIHRITLHRMLRR